MTALTLTHNQPEPQEGRHIVDQLIEQRVRRWRGRPLAWKLIKSFIYPLLGYQKAIRMADYVSPMGSLECLDWMSGFLHLRLEVNDASMIPASGPLILVANHPGSIVDGIAIFDVIKRIRRDISIFANGDALRVVPKLEENIIPVEWSDDYKGKAATTRVLRQATQAFRQERVVLIFPSGRVGYMTMKGTRERDWLPSAVSFARKFNALIIPIHVHARMSWLYYFFHFTNEELRDMTLFHEMLKKENYRYRLIFGQPIDAQRDLPKDPHIATSRLQSYVEHELIHGQTRMKIAKQSLQT